MGKNPEPGSGRNISNQVSNSSVTIFGLKLFKFFVSVPDSGSNIFGPRIQDPGWKNSGIRDKHPGSATLDRTMIKVTINPY
jgi:hypothetical protein